MANDIKRTFESYYIGKVSNNDDGRSLFRSEIVGYLDTLQNIGAIRNVDAQNDVTVTEGQDADSVVVQVGMQPVDSVEKIYMKVRVN